MEGIMTVWTQFEALHASGKVGQLGISNCYDYNTFLGLYQLANVKPTVLQNRFYSDAGYDKQLRQFCRQENIKYQSFWTLTANPQILMHPLMRKISEKYSKTPACIFFRALVQMGITPLTGTSSAIHMEQDLEVAQGKFELEESDVGVISNLINLY